MKLRTATSTREAGQRRLKMPVLALLMTFGLFTFTGCEFLIDNNPSGSGELDVRLISSPFDIDHVDEVDVEISRIDIRSRDHGTVTIRDEDEVFDLLDLDDDNWVRLGEANLRSGQYHQLQIWVDEARIRLEDGTQFNIKVPSERVRVDLDNFRIDNNDDRVLTLRFDLARSFVVQGNPDTPAGIEGFIFKPTLVPIGYESDRDWDDDKKDWDDHDDDDDDDDDDWDDD